MLDPGEQGSCKFRKTLHTLKSCERDNRHLHFK